MNEPEDIFSLKAALDSQSIEIEELQEEIKRLRAERDKAWLKIGSIRNEIDCRIQHGADSNGHLEAILKMIDKDE
jgi:hypothetical protein